MKIHRWCRDRFQQEGWWTALQFDRAVIYFGTWIENKLNEYDKQTGRHRYTLEGLLKQPEAPTSTKAALDLLVQIGAADMR